MRRYLESLMALADMDATIRFKSTSPSSLTIGVQIIVPFCGRGDFERIVYLSRDEIAQSRVDLLEMELDRTVDMIHQMSGDEKHP